MDVELRRKLEADECRQLLRKSPSIAQADVFLVEDGGHRYVVKDFRKRPWLMRVLVIRACLRHELKIMSQIADIDGVPTILGRLGKDAFAMDFIDGQGTLPSEREVPREQHPQLSFFQRLREIMTELHEHGVAHADLRRRNVLVTNHGPCVIDFGTGWSRKGWGGAVRRRIFNYFAHVDDCKALKLQAAYYPDSLTPADREKLESGGRLLRFARFMRKRVYRRYIKQKTWRNRVKRWRRGQLTRRRQRRI
jgi:predicted Ser/Thr protein kinase